MGDGKWETNGVKVNHPTPRLGYDAFESRTTLAVLENTVAQRKQKTGAYRLMNVELPRPTYISSWDKCQTFSFTCCAQQPAEMPVFQKGTETLTFRQREVGVRCWHPDPEILMLQKHQ